jgi:protein-disulfide isomerase
MNRERITLILAAVIALAALALLGLSYARPGGALRGGGSQALSAEQGDAILAELRRIRVLLERGQGPAPTAGAPAAPAAAAPPRAPDRLTVSVKGSPALGRAGAPLTLVEFTDYQCPFCRRFHEQTMPTLLKQYVETGKLRLVMRDLPLPIHPNAPGAAEAAHCAEEQGRFWQMQDVLFRNGANLGAERLPDYAKEAGADPAKFKACLASARHTATIRASGDDAARLGISGTPSFVLGRASGDTVTGTKLVGAQPLAFFQGAIDRELAAK